MKHIEEFYRLAKERYAELEVDTEKAMSRLDNVAVSLHCWQGDDVSGFEYDESALGGGLAVTGDFPGKARTPDELRADLEMAFKLIPGKKRVNLHAMYGELSHKKVDRNELEFEHFARWADWAQSLGIGLDFNPTCFSHPMAESGFTLSSADEKVRRFWIQHCIACRKIGEAFGKKLGSPCVTNIWIPDGYKDIPFDRLSPRNRLKESLDEIFSEIIDPVYNLDSVEPKLFGIGSESYVVGSHEFYLSYAVKRNKLLCLDTGHFHPTESIADKLSSTLQFIDKVLLHISRGVRWDSDHVVITSDEITAIAQEIVRGNFLSRVHIGLDYFDATINRVAAWVIGVRAMQKALLFALLEPIELLWTAERNQDYTRRLVVLEELKTFPYNAVWDYYCESRNVPVGLTWLDAVNQYEDSVQFRR